jgi:hypothetical protein
LYPYFLYQRMLKIMNYQQILHGLALDYVALLQESQGTIELSWRDFVFSQGDIDLWGYFMEEISFYQVEEEQPTDEAWSFANDWDIYQLDM